jgi:hypothetical protein
MQVEEFTTALQIACTNTDQSLEKGLFYSEYNYQNVLLYFLTRELPSTVTISREVHIPFTLQNGLAFGYGKADLVVESEDFVFILELKAFVDMRYSRKYCGQVLKYAEHYNSMKTRIPYLCVFGTTTPIVKRLP